MLDQINLPAAEESSLAFNVPAAITERFWITYSKAGNTVRLAFAEMGSDGEPRYHTAVIMSAQLAMELRNSIDQVSREKGKT